MRTGTQNLSLYLFSLVLALTLGACGEKPRDNSRTLAHLQAGAAEALESTDDAAALEMSQGMLVLKPSLSQKVWSLGVSLEAAYHLKKRELYDPLIQQLDRRLSELERQIPPAKARNGSHKINVEANKAYIQAETALRSLHTGFTGALKKQPDDKSTKKRLGTVENVYLKHFFNSLLSSQVLLNGAQRAFDEKQYFEAIFLFQESKLHDFEKKRTKDIKAGLQKSWKAVRGRGIVAKTPQSRKVPEAHAKWMKQAEKRIATGKNAAATRKLSLRLAILKLGFAELKPAYTLLENVWSQEKVDLLSAQSAALHMSFLYSYDKEAFTQLRERLSLEKNPELWTQKIFRNALLEISEGMLSESPEDPSEPYTLLQELIKPEDDLAAEAAGLYLNYAFENEKLKNYRKKRKILQKKKTLKKNKKFLAIISDLRHKEKAR